MLNGSAPHTHTITDFKMAGTLTYAAIIKEMKCV